MSVVIRACLCGLGALPALFYAAAQPVETAPAADWGQEQQATNTGGSSGLGVGRKLAVDSRGLHLLWTEHSGSTYDVFYARSTDEGRSWSAALDVARSSLPAMDGNVAVGPDDVLHAAWLDYRSGARHVLYSRSFNSGASWESARDISGQQTDYAVTPALSVDLRNRVHMAWHTGDADEASPIAVSYYVRSTDGGSTFGPVQRLSSATGRHAAWPRFSVHGTSGDVVAMTWRDNRRTADWDLYMAISTDGGATFTERRVQAEAYREWDPDTVVDPDKRIHVSYMHYLPGGVQIKYTRSDDLGISWTTPITLSEAHSRFSFWVPDWAHGALWLFWKDERDSGPDIVGKYSLDLSTWSAMEWVTDDPELDHRFPSPSIGPDGRPHVAWSDQRYGSSREAVFMKSRSRPTGPRVSD